MTVWRMRISRFIATVTNTHTDCVTRIVSLL